MSDQRVIEVTHVTQTSIACPSQWDAWTAAGAYVYVRYRHGCLSVSVDDVVVFERDIGDELDGHLTWGEVVAASPIVDLSDRAVPFWSYAARRLADSGPSS